MFHMLFFSPRIVEIEMQDMSKKNSIGNEGNSAHNYSPRQMSDIEQLHEKIKRCTVRFIENEIEPVVKKQTVTLEKTDYAYASIFNDTLRSKLPDKLSDQSSVLY